MALNAFGMKISAQQAAQRAEMAKKQMEATLLKQDRARKSAAEKAMRQARQSEAKSKTSQANRTNNAKRNATSKQTWTAPAIPTTPKRRISDEALARREAKKQATAHRNKANQRADQFTRKLEKAHRRIDDAQIIANKQTMITRNMEANKPKGQRRYSKDIKWLQDIKDSGEREAREFELLESMKDRGHFIFVDEKRGAGWIEASEDDWEANFEKLVEDTEYSGNEVKKIIQKSGIKVSDKTFDWGIKDRGAGVGEFADWDADFDYFK